MSSPILPERVRGVIYARVSDRDQTSIPEQESWARETAIREGIDVVGLYRDQGIPGSEIDDRRELQRMMDDVERAALKGKPVSVVLVWDADRLSRADSLETAALLKRLRDAGASRVLTSSQSVDLHNGTDRLLYNLVQEATRAAYSPRLSRDVVRSMAARAQKGFWTGGKPPFGYQVRDGRLVPGDAESVATVRLMFGLFTSQPLSTRGLALLLNKRGVKTATGALWSRTMVFKRLTDRTYLGELQWNRRHRGRFSALRAGGVVASPHLAERAARKRAKGLQALPETRSKPEDVLRVERAHEALIDAEVFGQVQARLGANSRERSPHTDQRWPLRGLVRCGQCGATCYYQRGGAGRAKASKDRPWQVMCGTYKSFGAAQCGNAALANADGVVRAVVGLLQAELGAPEALAEIRAAALSAAARKAAELDARRQTLQEALRSSADRLATMADNMLLASKSVFASANAALERAQEAHGALVAEMRAVDADTADAGAAADPEQLDKLLGLIGRLDSLLDFADRDALTDALRALVSRVEIVMPERTDKAKGKRRYRCADDANVAVTLAPSFAGLLSTVRRGEQAGIILRGPVRAG